MKQLVLELSTRPEPTLVNFVPGRNAEVLAHVNALARGAGERFIYLWGARASGRSHLLRAVVRAAHEAGRVAVLATAPHDIERIAALGADAALAIDDVEHLDAAGQAAVFAAYNRIRDGRGALIAAGSSPPASLGVRADLATRFAWGLVLEVHPLTDDEKAAAMRGHALARGVELPADVLAYLLRHAPRDLSSLLALVDALDRYSLETRRPLTVPLARDVLRPTTAIAERL